MVATPNLTRPLDAFTCFRQRNVDFHGTVFSGGEPLDGSLALLLLQVSMMVAVSQTVRFLLKPLKQPTITSDIIVGIIVGPSVLGRSKKFTSLFFPSDTFYLLATISRIGIVYYFFIAAVKQETSMILYSGRKAVIIGFCSLCATLAATSTVSAFIGHSVPGHQHLLRSLCVSLSITAFPVLHPVLAQLDLLNTGIGRLAMSSAMVNGLISLLLRVGLTSLKYGSGAFSSGLLFVCAFVAMNLFIIYVIRPALFWIARKTPPGKRLSSSYVVAVLLMVLWISFTSDVIGSNAIEGPLMMGLVAPAGPPLGSAL